MNIKDNFLINTFKDKNRIPFWKIWSAWITVSMLAIICNAINIVTLCFWRPLWDIKFSIWFKNVQLTYKIEKAMQQAKDDEIKFMEKMVDWEKKALENLDNGVQTEKVDKSFFS